MKLTLQIQSCILDEVNNHLNDYDSKNSSMKRVVCSKISIDQSKKNIVAISKKSKNRHVCHRQNVSSIRHSFKHLNRYAIFTRINSQHVVLYSSLLNNDQCMHVLKIISNVMINHRRKNDVDGNVYENQNRRNSCWQCASVERLLMFIIKNCEKCDVSSN